LTIRLISTGCKRFQFVGNIGFSPSFYDRWLGFRSALEEYEMTLEQDVQLIGPEAEDQLAKTIDRSIGKMTADAYVCANDFNAMTTIEALRGKGIDVPGECEVTGFDNTYAAELDIPILTVDVNKEWLGRRAVDKLMWRVANPTASIEKTLIYADVVKSNVPTPNKM
jgi:LacI family transcriptional regulator